MASELAVAYVTLSVSGKNIGKEVNSALSGAAGPAADSAGRSAGSRFAAGFKSLAGKAVKAGALSAGLVAGAALAGGFKSAIDQQNASKVLAGLYGSADKAKATMEGLAEVAKRSPLDYSSYLKGAESLAYAGVQGTKATKILKNVGLAITASGGNSENLTRATDAILSMVNAGKVQLDTLQQLSGAGVPILSGLAKKYGVTVDQINTLASDGKIKLDDVLAVMRDSTGKTFKTMTKAGEEASKSFGNQFQIAKNNVTRSIGTALLPVLDKLAPTIGRAGTAVSKFIDGMAAGTGPGGQFVDTVKSIGNGLKPVVGFVAGAVSAFNKLPGPVKSTAVQAGLFALILPRLTAGLTAVGGRLTYAGGATASFGAKMTTAAGRTALASSAMTRLSGAARSAAGVGGILALSSASKASSTGLQTLAKIGGGAMLGFSLGGPIGGAIGAGAGALLSLRNRAADAGSAFKLTKGDAKGLAESLDQVTGAATRSTRQLILAKLQQNGALKQAASVGVSSRTLIDATLGKPQAIAQAKAAVANLSGELSRMKGAYKQVGDAAATNGVGADPKAAEAARKKFKDLRTAIDALKSTYGDYGKQLRDSAAAQRINAAATANLSKGYRNVPKEVTTTLKADGVPHSLGEVQKLAAQYNLTPKQIQTVANLVGFDLSKKKANELRDAALGVPKGTTTKATTPGAPGAKKALELVTEAAKDAGKQKPSPKVSANASVFYKVLNSALESARRSSATVSVKADTSAFKAAVASAKAGVGAATIGVSKRAKGGPVGPSTGLTLVGEEGPELVRFGSRGTVYSNDKTMAMARNIAAAPVASTAGGGGFSGAIVITNWETGQGYFESIADGAYYSNQALGRQGC